MISMSWPQLEGHVLDSTDTRQGRANIIEESERVSCSLGQGRMPALCSSQVRSKARAKPGLRFTQPLLWPRPEPQHSLSAPICADPDATKFSIAKVHSALVILSQVTGNQKKLSVASTSTDSSFFPRVVACRTLPNC